MQAHKYILFFYFFIFSCEKNTLLPVESGDLSYVSLCSDKELLNTISVLSFNKLSTTSLNSVTELIEHLDPDIIGLQESYEMGLDIADRFNYCYYGNNKNSTAVLSKFPIQGINYMQSRIILNDSLYINFFNVHLTAYPYQPYDIRDTLITTESQAIYQAEQTRGEELDFLKSSINNLASNMPTIVVGDFNEPSHLDWISGAENPERFQIIGYDFIVDWPISNAMNAMNFIDAYREIYDNPILSPGYTWTPNISLNEVNDRIDFIYYYPRHDSVAVSHNFNQGLYDFNVFEISLESVYVVGPDYFSDIVIDNYESDHRGVFAVFNLDY